MLSTVGAITTGIHLNDETTLNALFLNVHLYMEQQTIYLHNNLTMSLIVSLVRRNKIATACC